MKDRKPSANGRLRLAIVAILIAVVAFATVWGAVPLHVALVAMFLLTPLPFLPPFWRALVALTPVVRPTITRVAQVVLTTAVVGAIVLARGSIWWLGPALCLLTASLVVEYVAVVNAHRRAVIAEGLRGTGYPDGGVPGRGATTDAILATTLPALLIWAMSLLPQVRLGAPLFAAVAWLILIEFAPGGPEDAELGSILVRAGIMVVVATSLEVPPVERRMDQITLPEAMLLAGAAGMALTPAGLGLAAFMGRRRGDGAS